MSVGQRLVRASDEPNDTFTFTVIDSPDLNAFATPGGFIYVNRGLLAYLDSEAELAGVLAHEIGHVTANHSARQQTANVANKVVATTAYILTGSGELADASNMYGTELVRGYGREHELEADGLGAKYMYNAGYDPEALLEVIGVLKEQEQYQRVQAKATGKPAGSYHGLYATHPRNDQRLQTVIRTAGDLGSDDTRWMTRRCPGNSAATSRAWSGDQACREQRDENRFYHNKLGFTFEQPPGWEVTAGAKAIVARSPDGAASLTVTIRRRDQASSPEQVLRGIATGALTEGAALDQAQLTGYTASSRQRRPQPPGGDRLTAASATCSMAGRRISPRPTHSYWPPSRASGPSIPRSARPAEAMSSTTSRCREAPPWPASRPVPASPMRKPSCACSTACIPGANRAPATGSR